MATIKTRENDLFRAGAVDVNLDLYEAIVNEANLTLGKKFLRSMSVESIEKAIKRVGAKYGFNGTGVIGKTVKLSLFLQDVRFTEEGATAELRLSLPIVATEREHGLVWEEILKGSEPSNVGVSIKNGEMSLDIPLKGEKYSVKSNGINNGKPSFIGNIAA